MEMTNATAIFGVRRKAGARQIYHATAQVLLSYANQNAPERKTDEDKTLFSPLALVLCD